MPRLILGVNSGIMKKLVNPVSNEILRLLIKAKINAVELSLMSRERFDGLSAIDVKLLRKFAYVSIHIPIMHYKNNKETEEIIGLINNFTEKTRINLLVFHPDCIKNWRILKNLKVPIAIENMDQRKKTGKSVKDLERMFKKNHVGFVLDVNHVFTNDPAMRLKNEMLKKFGHRLVEIHASGYSGEHTHMPICETKQDFLLEGLPPNIPIILESTMNDTCSVSHLKEEMKYVTRIIRNKNHFKASSISLKSKQ